MRKRDRAVVAYEAMCDALVSACEVYAVDAAKMYVDGDAETEDRLIRSGPRIATLYQYVWFTDVPVWVQQMGKILYNK